MSPTDPTAAGASASGRSAATAAPARPAAPQSSPPATQSTQPPQSNSQDTQPMPVGTPSAVVGTAPAETAPRHGTAPAARPESAPARSGAPAARATARPGTPRKVRLNVARLDPWSVLKLSFLLSVGVGIATVVATAVVWQVLNGMGVFGDVNAIVQDILGTQGAADFDLYDYVGRSRVLSLATVIAVANVVLLTALATLGAFLYNLSSGLVGGLHVTLSDD